MVGLFFRFFFGTLAIVAAVVAVPSIYLAAVFGLLDLPWLTGIEDATEPVRADHSDRDRLRERVTREMTDDNRFDMVLSESELNGLLNGELAGLARIREPGIDLRADGVRFAARLAGRIPIPIAADAALRLSDGRVRFELESASIGFVSIPEFLFDPADWALNRAANLNRLLTARGDLRFTELISGDSAMRLVGRIDDSPSENAAAAVAALRGSAAEGSSRPRARALRDPNTKPRPGAWAYLALGDSLAAGEGATASDFNFATRFWRYLESTFDSSLAFTNLGISGESTRSFVDGPDSQLFRAIGEIRRLQDDGEPDTYVHVITLTLGANDIFPVLEGPICRTGPADPVCKAALDDATGQIESGVRTVLERLRDAAGPETLILVATYYDPFDFGLGLAFERLSDETIRTLNDNILAAARTNDVAVADTHGLFAGRAAELTHVLEGDVHPVDAGYGALTLAFQNAYEAVGPFR